MKNPGINRWLASAAIALAVPACQAASVPFNMLTAPDAISRAILATPLSRIDEGTVSGTDASGSIHKNFPLIIEQNFARLNKADTADLLDNLSEKELSDLATLYTTNNLESGHADRLLPLLANRLDNDRLVRLSHHFGFAPVYAAIAAASTNRASTFATTARPTDIAPTTAFSVGVGALGGGGAMANAGIGSVIRYSNWTPSEIYMDIRTAPYGSIGRLGAMAESLSIIGTGVSIAWYGGQAIGNVANYLLQTYAPDLYTTIGGVEQQMVLDLFGTTDVVTAGYWESQMSAALAPPSSQVIGMRNSGGDYGSTGAWTTYWVNPSTCPRGQKCPPVLPH